MPNLHVIGAGPAGCFAACEAAKRGFSVAVSEEHARIGQPVHCSGLVSASGLEKMSDVVPYKKIIQNGIRRANLHGQHSRVSITFPKPKAYVIDRGGFDNLAAQKAEDLGAKFHMGGRITKISQLLSANVIGADGPNSSVAKLFNFPRIRSFACAWQGDFAYSSPDLSAVEVFFDPRIAPGFIGWVIPINEETAKIGLGVSLPKSVLAAKKKFLTMAGIEGMKPLSEFSAIIPIEMRRRTAGRFGNYNVCLAGDAAGQVKASSGGGIFFGAMCGKLAGEHFSHPEKYESAWREKYGKDLLLHHLLRNWLDTLTPSMLDAWLSMLKAMRIDIMLGEIGEMDEYSKMISPDAAAAMANAWLRN